MRMKRTVGKGKTVSTDDTMNKRVRKKGRHEARQRPRDIPMFPVVMKDSNESTDYFPRSTQPSPGLNKSSNDSQSSFVVSGRPKKCHLTVADLVPGSIVMGVIADYSKSSREFEVHLPFHLRGFIPYCHIAEERDIDSINHYEATRTYYHNGMRVLCVVTSNESQRLLLSLRPSLLNAGFSLSSLKEGMWLPVTIRSCEEFGYTASLGIPEEVTVYIRPPTDPEAAGSHPYEASLSEVRTGWVAYVGISDVNLHAASIYCCLSPASLLTFSSTLNVALVRSGMLVEAQVEEIFFCGSQQNKLPVGMSVTFCGVLKGFVPELHSQRCLNDTLVKCPSNVKPGTILTLRVMAVCFSTHKIFLSPVNEIVNWLPGTQGRLHVAPGKRLSSCVVVAVEPSFGARFSVSIAGSWVFADVSNERCFDSGGIKPPGSSNDKQCLLLNQCVPQARVVSFSLFEMAYVVITSPSLLSEALLLPQDLDVGQIVRGTVQHISDGCLFLKLSPYLTGLLPRDHVTDLPLSDLPKSVQLHKFIDVRVMCIENTSIWVTAKRSLLNPLVKPVGLHFELDFKRNQLVLGVVGRIYAEKPTVAIYFFNRCQGLLPKTDFEKHQKQDRCRLGAILQCRVVDFDLLTRTLWLSLHLNADNSFLFSVDPLRALCERVVMHLCSLQKNYPAGFTFSDLEKSFTSQSYPFCPHSSYSPTASYQRYEYISWAAFQNSVKCGSVYKGLIALLGCASGYAILLCSNEPEGISSKSNVISPFGTKGSSSVTQGGSNLDALAPKPVGLALLPLSHMSDDPVIENSTETSLYTCFQNVTQVIVLDSKNRMSIKQEANSSSTLDDENYSMVRRFKSKISAVLLSGKPSLVTSASESGFIITPEMLEDRIMKWIPGYVVGHVKDHVRVCVGHRQIIGIGDIPPDASMADFVEGRTVWVQITSILLGLTANATSHFTCNVRPWGTTQSCDTTAIGAQIVVGNTYEAIVTKTEEKNVWVHLMPSRTPARIPLTELPESPLDPQFAESLYPVKRNLPFVRIVSIATCIVGSCKPEIHEPLFKVDDIVCGEVKKKLYNGLVVSIHGMDKKREAFHRTAFCHARDIVGHSIPKESAKQQRRQWREALMKYEVGFRIKAQISALSDGSENSVSVVLIPSNGGVS